MLPCGSSLQGYCSIHNDKHLCDWAGFTVLDSILMWLQFIVLGLGGGGYVRVYIYMHIHGHFDLYGLQIKPATFKKHLR